MKLAERPCGVACAGAWLPWIAGRAPLDELTASRSNPLTARESVIRAGLAGIPCRESVLGFIRTLTCRCEPLIAHTTQNRRLVTAAIGRQRGRSGGVEIKPGITSECCRDRADRPYNTRRSVIYCCDVWVAFSWGATGGPDRRGLPLQDSNQRLRSNIPDGIQPTRDAGLGAYSADAAAS